MRPNIYVHSRLAIGVAAVCMLGLLINLFWNVRSFADVTPYHWSCLIVIVISAAFELLMWRAATEKAKFQAAAWGLLWATSAIVVAGISCGRNAETLVNRKAAVIHADASRLNHEREMAEARVDRDGAKEQADKAQASAIAKGLTASEECRSARKFRCEGATRLAEQAASQASTATKRYEGADARYWRLVVQLDNFKPMPPANMELKNLARLWKLLTDHDAEEPLEIVWPWLLTLITEMGFCRGISYGLGYRLEPQTDSVCQTVLPNSLDRTFSGAEQIANRCRGRNPLAMRRDDAEVDLITFIEINGCVPTQEFLRERWGIRSRGTISTWLKGWEELGLITREQDGRVKITKAAR